MSVTTTDYCNVIENAKQLGLNTPTMFAFLPRNFSSVRDKNELLHESTVVTIRKLFRQNGIKESRMEQEGDNIPCIQENDFSLVLPIVFVSSLIMSQNPDALPMAINVISNYATDFFKGIPGTNKVRLDIVVETKGGRNYKQIAYEGNCEGLSDLVDIIGKVFNNDR